MKNKTLTLIRNAKVVGNNSKSYDDKHPENPISLRPIHDACKLTLNPKLKRRLHKLSTFSRPVISMAIVHYCTVTPQ